MSLLFADIYEAIRCLRVQKGACEKDILKYVQERVGKCMKIGSVLKTIRTLNQLVEENVLKKNGKRYMFACPPKCPKQKCEEEEDDDDDDDEDDQDDMEVDDEDGDECDNEEEEDDDEDDDEEEEEEEEEEEDDDDDDDDGDGDECDEKDVQIPENGNSGQEKSQGNGVNAISNDKIMMTSNNTKGNGNISGKSTDDPENTPCNDSADGNSGKKTGRMSRSGSVMEKTGDGKGKGGEPIAFCVRDFIDSLNNPNTEKNSQEKLARSEYALLENMDATERDDIKKIFHGKRKRSRTQRNALSSCSYRSRSPIKGMKSSMYNSLKTDNSEEICFKAVSSRFLNELVDAEMDVDLDAVGTEGYRHRSPLGPKTSKALVKRTESYISNPDLKKTEKVCETTTDPIKSNNLANNLPILDHCPISWCPEEENDRAGSSEDDRNEEHASLCSVCEKKKLND